MSLPTPVLLVVVSIRPSPVRSFCFPMSILKCFYTSYDISEQEKRSSRRHNSSVYTPPLNNHSVHFGRKRSTRHKLSKQLCPWGDLERLRWKALGDIPFPPERPVAAVVTIPKQTPTVVKTTIIIINDQPLTTIRKLPQKLQTTERTHLEVP